jgi:hypothetical protein
VEVERESEVEVEFLGGGCGERKKVTKEKLTFALDLSLFSLPSSLPSLFHATQVKPGACAVESLPAPGSQYASDVCKGELARLMRR